MKYLQKQMDGWNLFMFGVFIKVTETQTATQKDENGNLYFIQMSAGVLVMFEQRIEVCILSVVRVIPIRKTE